VVVLVTEAGTAGTVVDAAGGAETGREGSVSGEVRETGRESGMVVSPDGGARGALLDASVIGGRVTAEEEEEEEFVVVGSVDVADIMALFNVKG